MYKSEARPVLSKMWIGTDRQTHTYIHTSQRRLLKAFARRSRNQRDEDDDQKQKEATEKAENSEKMEGFHRKTSMMR